MGGRIDYETLKQWFFEDAYQWCQEQFENGWVKKWHFGFLEWGGALDTFSESFDMQIENLMIDVIYIIMNAGRHEVSHNIVLRRIDDILSKYCLDELISPLGEEERKEFLYDLNLVLNNRMIER